MVGATTTGNPEDILMMSNCTSIAFTSYKHGGDNSSAPPSLGSFNPGRARLVHHIEPLDVDALEALVGLDVTRSV